MRAFGYIETQNFEAAEKTAKEVGLGIISSILNYSGMFTHEYMRQWTSSLLIQIMARHLSADSLPEPLLTYCQLDPEERTLKNIVYKMWAILSGPQCVNLSQ